MSAPLTTAMPAAIDASGAAVPRTWWPQQLLLGWLNLALAAPVIYLFIGLSLVMRQHGFTGTQMGVMLLAGLPAMLKFALAAPIDRWRFGRSSDHSYRNWAVALALAYAAALLWLAAHPLATTPYLHLFALIMLTTLLATWADVPVNALAIALLPESERIRAGAVRSAANSLGAIVGGGLMLVLHTHYGWAAPLAALALGVASCAVLVGWVRTPLAGEGPEAVKETRDYANASVQQCLAWFAPPAHRLWAVLLMLYYPLIGTAWFYLKPLMLDAGVAVERIAVIVGVIGGVVAAAAALAASRISRRIGARRALPLFALGDLLALAALAGVAALGWGSGWGEAALTGALTAAALFIALMLGASAGLVFGLMMTYARPGLAALDYGIQASLFVIGRTCIPILAGILLDRGGYLLMLASLMGAVALVLLLVVCAAGARIFPAVSLTDSRSL